MAVLRPTHIRIIVYLHFVSLLQSEAELMQTAKVSLLLKHVALEKLQLEMLEVRCHHDLELSVSVQCCGKYHQI